MPIVVNLDVMMARRHKGAGELAEEIGITPANLSILKNNKAKAVRFSTLEALCRALDCQPGNIRSLCRTRIGRGRACPARGLPAGKRLFYTAGPDLSGPYVEVMVCCMLF